MYNFFIGIVIFMCQFHGAKFIPGRYLLFCYRKNLLIMHSFTQGWYDGIFDWRASHYSLDSCLVSSGHVLFIPLYQSCSCLTQVLY